MSGCRVLRVLGLVFFVPSSGSLELARYRIDKRFKVTSASG